MKRKDLKALATRTFHNPGDAIEGERIVAMYRASKSYAVQAGTSTHQIQRSSLEGSVFCMIEKPLNYLRGMTERGERFKDST